jgi:hypothetical protein
MDTAVNPTGEIIGNYLGGARDQVSVQTSGQRWADALTHLEGYGKR